jgi:glycine/D-amino acid oxidase-like deaminating enzyme
VRSCVVGGGLAGTLLAWRLAQAAPQGQVDLVLGRRCRADATAASGGAVRAYEPDPEQRRLAIASLVELLASPTLRHWARYQRVDSVYLPAGDPADPAGLAEIERALPGSLQPLSAAGLARLGWADVHPDAVAVHEHQAGYLAPGRLREAVLAELATSRRVRLLPAGLDALRVVAGGHPTCRVAGRWREYDQVVAAAGAWTPRLLAAAGLPTGGYRTKSIQYTIYRTGDWRPPMFVDEVIDLYGRPAADGGLLLGLPTDQWGVDPDRPPVTPELHEAAVRLAGTRFPKLRIGPAIRTVGASDCYGAHPTLSLRPVVDTGRRLFTFTGGAGGCVKTALAATREAATRLASPGPNPGDLSERTPLAPREGLS